MIEVSKQALLLAAVLVAQPCLVAAAATTQPNIVVVLTDDQGWGDLGMHGNALVNTPNLDKLARDGARFDRFFVSPVCSPTRAEFLTGRHHVRCGVYDTSAGGERVNADEQMISEVLRGAGYRTAAFGKWHSGMQWPYHPNARGFEEFFGFCSGHWGDYFSPMLEHNGRIVQGDGFVVDDFTERAMRFIERNRHEPFFVYLPYNTPHSPMQVPERWWTKYGALELTQDHPKRDLEDDEHTRAALAMCENIDWNVGRLLGKLDELKLTENTIVVFFSDNGPNGDRWNGGMRGRKGSTDEGGVRSPLFIRWPAKIAPGTQIESITSAMDLLPTLAELAGIEVRGAKPLDGRSFAPSLLGATSDSADRVLIHHWDGRISVRTQQYRLDHRRRLYDMSTDPGQEHPLNESDSEIATALMQHADKFRAEMLDGHGREYDDRPFVIGHPDAEVTHIPARDGTAVGGIERSNRYPNDSFFQNWKSTSDAIAWDCEVASAGTYRVEIFYTCPEPDIGSTVELSFGQQRLIGRVTRAHDPPLRGMENDRVPRIESYVKDFTRITLGEIRLEAGPGTLTLRALDIPGDQVMDFRLMLLTRVGADAQAHD